MRIQESLLSILTAAVLVSTLAAQTPTLRGVASERSGTPIDFARVTVKLNGKVISHAATNSDGVYITKAAFGTLTVECEATGHNYATNPVTGQVKIPPSAHEAKQDCTFDRITIADSYWKMVVDTINLKALNSPDPHGVFADEWTQIMDGSLPPSAKAAAAHQLLSLNGSSKINSPKLKVYVTVDVPTVKNAEAGDPNALSNLPRPVRDDVQAYEKTKSPLQAPQTD